MVESTWKLLLDQRRTEPGWHALRVAPESQCHIQVAVRQPGAVLAVLVQVRARSIPTGTAYPECVGFALSPESVQPGPNGTVRLCLELRDPAYRELFCALGDDVIGVIRTATSDDDCVRFLLGRLNTWLRFVARHGPGLLPEEARVGLFAELRFMSSYLLGRVPASAAVSAWRGPLGESHDFHASALSIEVKASSAIAPSTVFVSNLDQLDYAEGNRLLVNHVSLGPGLTGLTLPSLVGELRTRIVAEDASARADFDAKLSETGYFDVHAEAYASPAYSVTRERWFEVTQGFPRLTRTMVPRGLLNASYAVSLESWGPFEKAATYVHPLFDEIWK